MCPMSSPVRMESVVLSGANHTVSCPGWKVWYCLGYPTLSHILDGKCGPVWGVSHCPVSWIVNIVLSRAS